MTQDRVTSTRRRSVLIAVLLASMLASPVLPALASRAPTRSEARAIRAAALRSLDGSGWKVSHIRVSRVSGRYRYAKAAVDNVPTGVGGEMFLRGRSNRWKRVFLGTDGFCDAKIPKSALRDLGFQC